MNVIIVDDSIQMVKAIKLSIDWQKLGVKEVYTAYNISQAKEIISENEIHIVISDIEMPQGSGIDLIKWLKINSPQSESILLTCHAEFEYAKAAIELGSFDYLVKPIPFEDLEEKISKLISKIEAGRKLKMNSEYWMDNQPLIEERFWQDLLTRKISGNPSIIVDYAKKRNVVYSKDADYLLILLTKKRLIASLEDWDKDSLNFALKNIAADIILKDLDSNSTVLLEDQITLILPSENNNHRSLEDIKRSCIEYIVACNKHLGCSVSSYIGKYVKGDHLADVLDELQQLDNNNVSFISKVFDLNTDIVGKNTESKIILPNLNEWSLMLHNGESERVIVEVKKYIDELVKAEKMDGKILNILHQDILQMLYSFLEQKGMQAHQLFDDEKSEKLYMKATKSTEAMLNWVAYVICKAINYVNEVTKSQSVIGKVKEYMKNNYDKDITREDIANFVYLNPDYLTRIFKKETGLSLSEYLTEQRINKSMLLLANSKVQISSIATEVGYNNINYFSKTFKKVTGFTPVEYRKKYQSRG